MKPPSDLRALAVLALLSLPLAAPAWAQDLDIPPPPDEGAVESSAPAAAPVAQPAASVPAAPAATPAQEKPKASAGPSAADVASPEAAAQYQLKKLQAEIEELEGAAKEADNEQFGVWRRLEGIRQYPSVSVHGVGRAFGLSQEYFRSDLTFVNPRRRWTEAYLDLMPMGSVSKQVRWDAVLRFSSNLQTSGNDEILEFLRATLEFNPEFMSATLGDFNEAYTPFTVWNRNSLDLHYKPEMMERWDDLLKHEAFLNEEPAWPFRGLKVGTTLGWTDKALDRFHIEAFAHMIRSGYNESANGANFFGPFQFTDWVFAGRSNLRTKKFRFGNMSFQAEADAFGYILDEFEGSDTPTAGYDPLSPNTWTHQYRVGSVRPQVRLGFGNGFYLGAEAEMAFSEYDDDKRSMGNSPALDTTTTDYAFRGGPFVQFGDSKLSFVVLDVGPNYFSPLAQIRQDHVTISPDFAFNPSAEIHLPHYLGQSFITDVLRPGEYFGYYDRSMDNVFPYGLATPNRLGWGGEIDIQALQKKALKFRVSGYYVEEMSGNLVSNIAGTDLVAVETNSGLAIPIREFLFGNAGFSLDVGPLAGLDRKLEFGVNGRMEHTESLLGELDSLWILGGLTVEPFKSWEVSAAFTHREAKGQEAGVLGTLWARSVYLYDNADLGSYQLVDLDGTVQSVRVSTSVRVNVNSRIMADYSLAWGDFHPFRPVGLSDRLHNQFMGLGYEIEF